MFSCVNVKRVSFLYLKFKVHFGLVHKKIFLNTFSILFNNNETLEYPKTFYQWWWCIKAIKRAIKHFCAFLKCVYK